MLYEEKHTELKSISIISSSSHFTPRCATSNEFQSAIVPYFASVAITHSQHEMPHLPTPSTYSCKVMYFWAVTSTSYDAVWLDVESVPSASTLTRPSPPPAGCTIPVVGVAVGRTALFGALQDPEQFDLATRTTQPNSYQAYRCLSLPSASSRSCRMQPSDKNYLVTSEVSVLCARRVIS
jgi:hypothetical protein